MALEARQTPRSDLVDTVFPLVEVIRRMLARVETLWAEVGINPSEAAVLERLFIDHDGEARSGALLGHPIRSTPALGKVLSGLEDKTLITRHRSSHDGRVVVVTGTDAARDLHDQILGQILSVVVGPTTGNLEEEDFADLRRITRKLTPPDTDD